MSKRFALACTCLTLLLSLSLANPARAQDEGGRRRPHLSLAVERVGGLAYARVSADDSDASLSAFTAGLGGPALNPFAVPRLGVDYITSSGLTLGGAVGLTRTSISYKADDGSGDDLGSALVYSLTPRVGYRLALTDRIDLTPRAGATLLGASVSAGDDDADASVFAVALGVDAPLAFRLTDSFHVLLGAGVDYTVAATTSTSSKSDGGSRSSSEDVKGALLSAQAWLGLGGYL